MRISCLLLLLCLSINLGWAARAMAAPLPGARQSGGPDTTVTPDAAPGTYKLIYSFHGADGAYPRADLLALNNMLYGTTALGGTNSFGTVFAVNPDGGKVSVLHSFGGPRGDGRYPYAGLIAVNGLLYGTTYKGGPLNDGTVFEVDPSTRPEHVLHIFLGGRDDGVNPYAGLVELNGLLYGTTNLGGVDNDGTVFAVDPSTGAERVLHNFTGYPDDGDRPYAGLIAVEGLLYGTTYKGGLDDAGTVYAVDPSTGDERVLHSFNYEDGAEPYAGLLAVNGLLYGTTSFAGANHGGTVFAVDPSTGTMRVIYNFSFFDIGGYAPLAGLIEVNGWLYGTTYYGGEYRVGTVFAVAP